MSDRVMCMCTRGGWKKWKCVHRIQNDQKFYWGTLFSAAFGSPVHDKIQRTRWPGAVLQSINYIRLNNINRLIYYNVKIRLVYLDKLCWLKQNLVEQVHQCKVMLGWVSTILFSSRNLLTYNASKIVNCGLSELCLTSKWDRISPGMLS